MRLWYFPDLFAVLRYLPNFLAVMRCLATPNVPLEFVTQDTEKCPLSVLTGVRIKRVNLRENVRFFVETNETVRNTGVSVLSGCP